MCLAFRVIKFSNSDIKTVLDSLLYIRKIIRSHDNLADLAGLADLASWLGSFEDPFFFMEELHLTLVEESFMA